MQGHHGATFTDVSSTKKGPKTKQAMYNLHQTNAVGATVLKNESFVFILSNVKQTPFLLTKLIITFFVNNMNYDFCKKNPPCFCLLVSLNYMQKNLHMQAQARRSIHTIFMQSYRTDTQQ